MAAHIVLDIYNIKKDYEGLVKTATLFVGVKELGDAEFRTEVAKITGEIDFKRIEQMEAKGNWKEAGDAYAAYYKKNPTGNLSEKSLYNAYVSYDKATEPVLASDTAKLF